MPLTHKHLQQYVIRVWWGLIRFLHYGSKETEELIIRLSFDEKNYEYEIKLTASGLRYTLYRFRIYPVEAS